MLHIQLCRKWNLPDTSTHKEVADVQREHARRQACLKDGLSEDSSWGVIAEKRSNDARIFTCHMRGLSETCSWKDLNLHASNMIQKRGAL